MHAGSVHVEQEHQEQPSEPAVAESLAPPAPLPLVVGAADDHAEVDADRRADAALARLAPAGEPVHAHGVRRSAGGPSGAIGLAGGALDGDTEQRLSSRLGRGGALDASVRRRMEGAFGTSFSGVNVHTDGEADRLSRQMSATAFTVGKDMFFSKGAYRPGDSSGDRLIAHELAHVQQEGDGAHRMVHRAVGFEFETNIMVKKRLPNATFQKLPKATVLKQYDGFRMETDENSQIGSTIEFVVDPPIQENNRKGLVSTMKKLTSTAEKLIGDRDWSIPFQNWVPTISLRDQGVSGVDRDIWILPDDRVIAMPQVTGGIDLDKIIDMMSEIGSGDHSQLNTADAAAASSLDGIDKNSSASAAAAVKRAAPPTGLTSTSKELQGIAALLVAYLTFGSLAKDTKMLNYAKLISNSVMLRTDFGTLFQRLPANEYDTFIHDPDAFITWILTIAGLQGAPAVAVYERGIRTSNDPQNPSYNIRDTTAGLDITREDWLRGITMGNDLLSAKTNQALAAKLEGLGALGGKFDAVGDEASKKPKHQQKTGAVMEFRNMAKDLKLDEWSGMATGVFDYLSRLNKR